MDDEYMNERRLTFVVEIDAVAAVAQRDVTLVKASGDFGSLPGQSSGPGCPHQQPDGKTQNTTGRQNDETPDANDHHRLHLEPQLPIILRQLSFRAAPRQCVEFNAGSSEGHR